MHSQIAALCQDRVFHHFYEISQIPRGSGNEKAVSDYVRAWAAGLGLEAIQDEQNNVFIRKPASPGYEDKPAVLLQAHLDMVCEKAIKSLHDFLRDPIPWVLEGDWLTTGGETTLGADDGIGVALIMAVLEDSTLPHPAIEALFTTNEEEDMTGAASFDCSLSHAQYLINLDHTVEDQINCGSCGGMQVDFWLPLEHRPVPADWKTYKISLSGLKGGHSGEDIHRGRGNANRLLARILSAAEDAADYLIQDIRGGSFRLAIPREAEAVICINPAQVGAVRQQLMDHAWDLVRELPESGRNVAVSLEPLDDVIAEAAVPANAVSAMLLIPDGIAQMNEALTGLVDVSDNLGEMYLEDGQLHLVLEIRCSWESEGKDLYRRMERLAKLLGGHCTSSNAYPSWHYRPASKLRDICSEAYAACYDGAFPTFLTVHAGLETGYLLEKKPDMDAVSIGPNCLDFHSPGERLSVSSVQRFYKYLCAVLAHLG